MINGPFPFGVLGFCLNGRIAMGQLSLRNSLPLTQTIPMQQIVYFFWYSNNHYFYSRGQFCGFTPRAVFSFMLLIASRWSQIYLILKFLDVGVMKKIVSFKAHRSVLTSSANTPWKTNSLGLNLCTFGVSNKSRCFPMCEILKTSVSHET